ncbi:hypothetical protein EC957_008120 [Mortierella hygrophila]|uniref:Uncharacterized protein n=1 Tax=Mortierella hygrophila TaxID=979708 RepID=A0A9P6FIA0_9FUNG|nr:hypothetical protein EC957_008120 [Mortierella hygrophila]
MSSTLRTSRKRPVSALLPILINDTEDGGSKRSRTERGGEAVKRKAVKDKAVGGKEDDTKFWKKFGMNTFLDWLLNTDNLQQFETTGTTAGTLVKDLRDEIVTYINDNSEDRGKDGWKPWTGDNVKYNKTACEAKYRRARDLMKKTGGGDDDTNTLEEQVRKICPMFTRFHGVYLRSVRVTPFHMVQTTTIPGEPEPVFDNSDENSKSDRSDSDESDEGDAGYEHVQVEGFDLEKFFEASDYDVETRTTNSTTAPARLSQQQKKHDKKKAGKGKGKDVEAHLLIGQKLDTIAQERGGGNVGLLVGLTQNLQKREQDWLQYVHERQLELDRTLAQRRDEHDKALAQHREGHSRELAAEKERWRVQMQKEMDFVHEQKEKFFQERCRFLQQQTGRTFKATVNQTFNITTP